MSVAPVIFLVFNRPSVTARVFARIREARPSTLFVVADGPRRTHSEDARKCKAVRDLIDQGIDWPCEVVRDYSEGNLGCGKRVFSGITRAFESVSEAIVLEDDCLPDLTFFRYCSELLERYREEPQIASISGSHHQLDNVNREESYYFCRYGNIWGWATWRRVWSEFDYSMTDWPSWRDSGGVERLFAQRQVQKFWRGTWDQVVRQRIDTWDYRWTYFYLKRGMLGILPYRAMVENLGFGVEATHTFDERYVGPKVFPMAFPLLHPGAINADYKAEEVASRRFFLHKPIYVGIYCAIIRRFERLMRRLRPRSM